MDRLLSAEETAYIISIKEKDICEDLLFNWFARYEVEKPPKFSTNDYFMIPKNTCCDNKNAGYTTIGIYLFNRFIIEPLFVQLFGYLNEPATGPVISGIEETIAKALYNSKIQSDVYADFLDRIQWLGGNGICTIISPSITASLLTAPDGFAEYRDKLVGENKVEIDKGNPIVGVKLEKDLLNYSESKIKDDPGYENFASKSKISLGNHYKTMQVRLTNSLVA